MSRDRRYPEEVSGPFESPPLSFIDRTDREMKLTPYDGSKEDKEALVQMYLDFDPSDRAQGIPPGQESRIRTWLDTILSDECLNVIAWDDQTVAGHATLVPDGDAYELAIFVLQAYQEAGIGTYLIKSLLGYGAANDVRKVWLTVERWNRPAVGLYKKVGFETSNAESFELEMAIRLHKDPT
ncbi:GNAT family N-acetyltransferase [Natronocalculus amylovorans]|uniref:GNAT family N-acetyltransferase n=1 Tax=Natronocalculus amylovorans TaxID=2917812 RepID=A0AAE3K835_9EURY|nr:GNAT family N-acetyltransferase [Natronocalculus amylovorans]MCL9816882.1 GNAT family N-acetyltransferase [Natronocalculus amylovorans]NUE01323.1 GNAT family N-acetyltransferase [Halorubraceae archaeon YAN]